MSNVHADIAVILDDYPVLTPDKDKTITQSYVKKEKRWRYWGV